MEHFQWNLVGYGAHRYKSYFLFQCKKKKKNVTQGLWMVYYFITYPFLLWATTNPIPRGKQIIVSLRAAVTIGKLLSYQHFWIYIFESQDYSESPVIVLSYQTVFFIFFLSKKKKKKNGIGLLIRNTMCIFPPFHMTVKHWNW